MPAKSTKSGRISLKVVAKTSVCEDLARQIMRAIAKGDLKPGQRLPAEREFCEDFGVGRSSLREAHRCLSIIGVLDARLGEGTSVAASGGSFLGKLFEWRLVTQDHDLEKLLDVRLALESVTAWDVAKNATDWQVCKLQEMVERMRAAESNPAEHGALDAEFHLKIAEASTNSLLVDLVSILRGRLSLSVQRVPVLPDAIPHSQGEHEAIVAVIVQRDPMNACRAMEVHLTAALHRYQSNLAAVPWTGKCMSGIRTFRLRIFRKKLRRLANDTSLTALSRKRFRYEIPPCCLWCSVPFDARKRARCA